MRELTISTMAMHVHAGLLGEKKVDSPSVIKSTGKKAGHLDHKQIGIGLIIACCFQQIGCLKFVG
jgi:hypothetical protein